MKQANNTTTAENFINEYQGFVDVYKILISEKDINEKKIYTAATLAGSVTVQEILKDRVIKGNEGIFKTLYQRYTRFLINNVASKKNGINIDPSDLQKIQKNLKRRKKRLEHHNYVGDEDNSSGIVSIFQQD